MAEGWSVAAANSAIDALLAAYPWVKMHTAAPGANGTSNAATETTRKTGSWPAASSASTSLQLQWTNVAGAEDWTHCTGWTASSAGSFGWSGTVTLDALTAGNTATVTVTVSLPTAS